MDGDDIIFRTSPHTELGRSMAHGPVAFEVDDFDDFSQSGWSVLVQGSAEYDDPDPPPVRERPQPVGRGRTRTGRADPADARSPAAA